jgi:hypothetical protein
LRIVGVRGEQSDFVSRSAIPSAFGKERRADVSSWLIGQFAIGSIKGDYLGPMED